MNKNKVIWTAGAVAVGLAAAGAVGLMAGQAMKSHDKKPTSARRSREGGDREREPFDMSEEARDSIVEVVWRESGLT